MDFIKFVQNNSSNDSSEFSIKFEFPKFSSFNECMLLLLDHEIPYVCCGFYTRTKKNEETKLCQLIDMLRTLNNVSFSLKYKNMSEQTFETLLTDSKYKDFMPSQPKISLSRNGIRFLDKEMSSSPSLRNLNELKILAAVGIKHMLILEEVGPVPWKAIIMVSCLAGVQIAAGAACLGFGCVNVGLALISEGVGDTFMAVDIYRKRKFRMKGLLTKKAISLAFSMVTLGINVAGAVQTASAAVTAENVVRQGAQEVAERVAQQFMSNLAKHAVKGGQMALLSVSREIVGLAVNEGASGLEARIKERVRHSISDKLGECLNVRGEFRKCIQKLIALDSILKRQNLRNELQSTLESLDVLGPLSNFLKSCVPLADTLSEVFGGTFDKFAKCLAVAEALCSTVDLYRFLNEKVLDKFMSKVQTLNQSVEISKVLSEFVGITHEKSNQICFKLALSNEITFDWAKFDWDSKASKIDAADACLKPKLSEFFRLLKHGETNYVLHNLITQIAERISDNVYELIRQQHIEPLRNGLNKVSKRIHDDTLSNEYIRVVEEDTQKEIQHYPTLLQFVDKMSQKANKVPESVYAKIEENLF
jgi:hypothetical protein